MQRLHRYLGSLLVGAALIHARFLTSTFRGPQVGRNLRQR